MTNEQFCKVLDEQYSTWHAGQKVLFLECISYSITKTIRRLCGKPVTEILANIKYIGIFNELQQRIPQAVTDILFSTGTVNGDGFRPGESLLSFAKALSMQKGSIQRFAVSKIDMANSRIAAVAEAEKQGEGEASKVNPVFHGLAQINASALSIG